MQYGFAASSLAMVTWGSELAHALRKDSFFLYAYSPWQNVTLILWDLPL